MPIETDRVAHAARVGLQLRAVGLHAQDGGIAIRVGLADVAGRADRHVEPAVGPEGDELPAVVAFLRQLVGDDDGRRRIGQPLRDAVQAQDAVDGGDVEAALPVGHADRHVQSAGDDVELAGAVLLVQLQRVHLALAHRPHVENAIVTQRHLPRIGHVRQQLDGEARRQAQLVQANLGVGRSRRRQHHQQHHRNTAGQRHRDSPAIAVTCTIREPRRRLRPGPPFPPFVASTLGPRRRTRNNAPPRVAALIQEPA